MSTDHKVGSHVVNVFEFTNFPDVLHLPQSKEYVPQNVMIGVNAL